MTSLSHPDKVLWPQAGFTKRDLLGYYEAVADRLLPHLRDRPLTLARHNNGVDKAGFWQKNLPDSAPASIRRFSVWTETSQRDVHYALFDDIEDLRWAAGQNAVELHPWFSRLDKPEAPDLLAFDLDPSGPSPTVPQAARWLRELLQELGVDCRVKTSGKRGLHLFVRLERRYGFDEVRAFALAVGRMAATRHPDDLTVQMRKADRGDRLLVDWSRAGGAQTLAAAWSPRTHPAGTVSTPLEWDEVTDDLDVTAFTLATAPSRPDPWAKPQQAQRIEAACAALEAAGFDLVDRSPRARTK